MFKVLGPGRGELDVRYAWLQPLADRLYPFFDPAPAARLGALFIIFAVILLAALLR